jgi:predicted TIM-barrel fold metal-dependent hydrolase
MIDTHVHLIDPDQFEYPWLADVPDLSGSWSLARWSVEAREAGVSSGILMEVDVAESDRESEAEYFCKLATEPANRIAGVVAACRPETDSFKQQLDRLDHPNLVGLRRVLHVAPEGTLQSPHLVGNLKMLAKRGLPFDLCARADQLIDVLRLTEACPDTQFVLDHAGNPPVGRPEYRDWETSIAALALRPNLVCKVSGLVNHLRTSSEHKDPIKTLRPVVDYVAHKFGMHRLMFGGDWPVSTLAGFDLPAWATLIREIAGDWSLADQESFFETNAHRVYGIH